MALTTEEAARVELLLQQDREIVIKLADLDAGQVCR